MQSGYRLPPLLEGPADILVDTRARSLKVAGRRVPVTRMAFNILSVLLNRRGEVVSHDELAALASGQESVGDHGAIQTGVYRLRRALGTAGARDVIQSIRGVGYTIEGTPQQHRPTLLERDALEAALRSVPLPALLVDTAGRAILATDAAAELTGMGVETLEQLPTWLEVLTTESHAAAMGPFAAAVGGHEAEHFPASAISVTDDSRHPVRVALKPVSSMAGVIGVLVTLIPGAERLLGAV